jgi:hypothetical protein
MKNLKNILTTLLLAFILINSLNAQTIANFKFEHTKCSMTATFYIVNTVDFNMYNELPFMGNFGSNYKVYFPIHNEANIKLTDIIPNKNNVGDTVCIKTINFVNYDTNIVFLFKEINTNISKNNNISIYWTDFLINPNYFPCYVTLGPILSIPTIKWESIDNNLISKYVIKRNGQTIDTINFSSGILSYTDVNNSEALNYIQTYTLIGIDSLGNIREGDVTTIHARNLASVNGNVELDWNIPTVASTISSFDIYEYDATLDVLTLINTVPSNITQYTITNPDVTKMYIVGVPNIDCSGSATRSSSTSLLSNPVQAIRTSGIESLIIDRNDEVIGYFDLMGREIDSNTTNQLMIIKYKSGKTVQKFIQQ